MTQNINLPKKWLEEPGLTKVLFDIQENNLEYQFTQDMWSEEPGMTKVLFDTQKNDMKY